MNPGPLRVREPPTSTCGQQWHGAAVCAGMRAERTVTGVATVGERWEGVRLLHASNSPANQIVATVGERWEGVRLSDFQKTLSNDLKVAYPAGRGRATRTVHLVDKA